MIILIQRKQARQNKLNFYFTGKQCIYGHISKRRTSNGFCLECEKVKQSTVNGKEKII